MYISSISTSVRGQPFSTCEWCFAAVDLALFTHVRIMSSLERRFRHGLLSKEEEKILVRQRLMRAIAMPNKVSTYRGLYYTSDTFLAPSLESPC